MSTFTPEQAQADLLALNEFQAIETSVARREPPSPVAVARFKELIAQLPAERAAHWNAELQRMRDIIAAETLAAQAASLL